MSTLRITKHCKQQEWKIVIAIAVIIGFTLPIIHNWKKKLINNTKRKKTPNHNKTTNQKLGNILL